MASFPKRIPESEERLAKIRDWVNTLNLPDLGTGASESYGLRR